MLNIDDLRGFWGGLRGLKKDFFGQEIGKQYLCAPIIIKVIARFGNVVWNLAVPQGVAWAIN